MKKIFMLLVAFTAMVFVSCSDDDGEDNVTRGANGEKLVSKVILIDAEDKSEDIYMSFSMTKTDK